MKNKKRLVENIIHGIFLVLGLITVGCVLLITDVYKIQGQGLADISCSISVRTASLEDCLYLSLIHI